MTSELVIMTPNAVAMAADSAVTVGNSKTYTGVDKLFKLSNDPPVGIMVFNNTRFLNIPFETIIKEFKKNSNGDGNEFKTVRDFQNGFIDFFKILTTKSEFKNSFENALQNVLVELKQLSANVDNFYQTIINFEVNNNVLLNSISNALDNNQLDKCIEIASDFEKILNKSDYDEKIFIRNFVNYLIWEMFAKHYTGIVLSGFDDDKLFPSCMSFNICYLYDDKYVLCDFQRYEISPEEGDVRINMFAQHEVINTFLRSINPNSKSNIMNFFKNQHDGYFNGLIDLISSNDSIDEDIKKNIIRDIQKYDISKNQYDMLLTHINNIENEHVNPMLHSIGSLPHVELSNLCESLIKITSLKRKVGFDLETVGGDVDVALITKGDGFIWTKHNNYCDVNLNL